MGIDGTSNNKLGLTQKAFDLYDEIQNRDGKKGISSLAERNELAEILSGVSIQKDREIFQRQIDEFDLKELNEKGDVRKFVRSAIEGALKLVKGGDNEAIDDELELKVLDNIIDNVNKDYTEDEIKYAILTKKLRTTNELKLKVENKELKNKNGDLVDKNLVLTEKNKELMEENKTLKEKLNAMKQAKKEADEEKEAFNNIKKELTTEANKTNNPAIKNAINNMVNSCDVAINNLEEKAKIGKQFEELQKSNDTSKLASFANNNYNFLKKFKDNIINAKEELNKELVKVRDMQLKGFFEKFFPIFSALAGNSTPGTLAKNVAGQENKVNDNKRLEE